MYLSPDPIGLAGGIRPNAYVHNPTTYIDPLGLAPCPTSPKPNPNQVQAARQRQHKMLEEDVGYNVTPFSTDRQYSHIGAKHTYLTDRAAIESVIGKIPSKGGRMVITRKQANELERQMGLKPESLSESGGFNIRQVQGIKERGAAPPTTGNDYFLGAGNNLPGGGPELVVPTIPTAGGPGISIIGKVIVE